MALPGELVQGVESCWRDGKPFFHNRFGVNNTQWTSCPLLSAGLYFSVHCSALIWRSTYRGLGDPAHRHGDAQQGVALILRQSQQLRDVPESLRWGVPVQTGCCLPVRHQRQVSHVAALQTVRFCVFIPAKSAEQSLQLSEPEVPSEVSGWLTEERCSTAPLCGGCEVLQARCCGADAGRCCRRELWSGQSSPLTAGPSSTLYTSPCEQRSRK